MINSKSYILSTLLTLCVAHNLTSFSDVPCERKNSQSKIVGGGDAAQGEFPWLVSIKRRGNHFCGGSLISNRLVLTAAHCICNGVDGFIKPASIKITVSQHDLLSSDSNTQEMLISRIIAHTDYKCNKARNDIAILELASNVTWTNYVQPACFSTKFVRDDKAIVAGWGRTNENRTEITKKTTILQKAKVTILNNDVCQNWYQSQGKKIKINYNQLCAGRKEGGVDACWADSGGPLVLEDYTVVGVVSTGIGCARPFLPGIYTRVSEFLPWIQSVVDKSNLVN